MSLRASAGRCWMVDVLMPTCCSFGVEFWELLFSRDTTLVRRLKIRDSACFWWQKQCLWRWQTTESWGEGATWVRSCSHAWVYFGIFRTSPQFMGEKNIWATRILSYTQLWKNKKVLFKYLSIQRFRYGQRNSTRRWVDVPHSSLTSFTRYTGLPTFSLKGMIYDWSDFLVCSQKVHTEIGPGRFREGCTCTQYISRPGWILYLLYSRPLRKRLELSTSIRPWQTESHLVHSCANIASFKLTWVKWPVAAEKPGLLSNNDERVNICGRSVPKLHTIVLSWGWDSVNYGESPRRNGLHTGFTHPPVDTLSEGHAAAGRSILNLTKIIAGKGAKYQITYQIFSVLPSRLTVTANKCWPSDESFTD